MASAPALTDEPPLGRPLAPAAAKGRSGLYGSKRVVLSGRDLDEFSRRIVDETADAVVATDAQQRIVFVNRAAQKMFGYAPEAILGQPLTRLMPERYRAGHEALVSRYGDTDVSARYMGDRRDHIIGLNAAGEELTLGATITQFRIGPEKYYAAVVRDVSERLEMTRKLAELASTDSLTGCLNRRSFLEKLEEEYQRASRFQSVFSVLMFDIDHFKNVNDTYGHDVGDDVLRDFSKVAKESLRSIDRFARWGGEEFIALLPRTDIEGAYKTAERIRRRFAEHRLATPRGETVTATVSTGVAAFDQGGKDMMEIVKAADQALYAAKSNGRNQVATRPSKDPVT